MPYHEHHHRRTRPKCSHTGCCRSFAALDITPRHLDINAAHFIGKYLTLSGVQVAGMLGPALCLTVAMTPVAAGNADLATGLITVAQGLSALTLGAVSVSQLDIAPKHAGAIFGLGNTFATLSGLLSVRLTGDMLEWTHSWLLVFTVASAHYLVGAGVWYAWVGSDALPEDKW
jgi:hypothetical protein